MKVMLSCLCTFFSLSMISVAALRAETTEVVLSNAMKCTKEELMKFFPEQIVRSILIKAGIPKDQAEQIAQELSLKDQEILKIQEEKVAKLGHNFSHNLSQRDLAQKIYRETLFEIFANVLRAHGVTDENQIQSLLDQLQDARSNLFIECIRKQKR
jgi:hypothetical protein